MGKVTVWRCDKCAVQIEQNDKPDGWATAEVLVPPDRLSYSDDEFSFLWCKNCWSEISQKLPKVEVNRG